MKYKILLFTIAILFLGILISQFVYAEEGDIYLGDGIGTAYSHESFRDEHDKLYKSTWLYDLELKNDEDNITTPVQLPITKTMVTTEYGQLFYWGVNNGGNPKDFSKVSAVGNAKYMFDIYWNRGNFTGHSYQDDNGYNIGYPTYYPVNHTEYGATGNAVTACFLNVFTQVYYNEGYFVQPGKKNWNYKDRAEGFITHPRIYDKGDPRTDQKLWLTDENGLKGSPRYIFSQVAGQYDSSITFASDLIPSDPVKISSSCIMALPHTDTSINMDQGAVNVKYQNKDGSWRVGKEVSDVTARTYEIFRLYWWDKGLKEIIEDKPAFGAAPLGHADIDSLSAEDRIKRLKAETKVWLYYFEVDHESSSTGYGHCRTKFNWGGGAITYHSYSVPKHIPSPTRDIKIGSIEHPLGEKSSFNYGYHIKLWELVNGVGVLLDPDKDTLIAGHEYYLHSFLGYEEIEQPTDYKDNVNITYHSGIKTNVYQAINEETKDSVFMKPPAYPNQYPDSTDASHTPLTDIKLKPYNLGAPIGNDIITKIGNDYISDYRTLVKVPLTAEDSSKVNKITFYSHVDYEKEYYSEAKKDEPSYDPYKDDNGDHSNDYAAITFNVKSDQDLSIPEMRLYEKKADGSYVEKIAGTDSLEPDKDYYIKWTVKNSSETMPTISNPLQSGLNDPLVSPRKYYDDTKRDETSGDLYNPQSKDPFTGTNNPALIPAGGTTSYFQKVTIPKDTITSSVTYKVFIPKAYDTGTGTGENQWIKDDDTKALTFKIGNATVNDIIAQKIELIDEVTGENYNQLNGNGSYKYKLYSSYKIVITAQKVGDKFLKTPKMDLQIIDANGATQSYTLNCDDPTGFNTDGKTLTFTMPYFHYTSTMFTLVGTVPEQYQGQGYNDITTNDRVSGIWSNSLNFQATNLKLTPSEMIMSQGQYSINQQVGFTVDLSVQNMTETHVDNVQLVVMTIPNNQIVYQNDNIVFTQDQSTIHFQGSIPKDGTFNFIEGNNAFRAVVNYNKKYAETNSTPSSTVDPTFPWRQGAYYDNVAEASVDVNITNIQTQQMRFCDQQNTQANWSVTYYMFLKTGTMKSRTYSDSHCSKTSCYSDSHTIYWCENVNTRSWTETRNYIETFKITGVMFKSQDTIAKYGNNFINILNNNNGTVKAGQWYEFYIQTNYYTDRVNMPPEWYTDMCNYQTRTPDLSTVSNTPPSLDLKISGYGETEIYKGLRPYYSSGPWNNKINRFRKPDRLDVFGDSKTRIFIPVRGVNGQISISVVSEAFDGYIFDYTHPNKKFQDCISNAIVYVQNPLGISTQIRDEK